MTSDESDKINTQDWSWNITVGLLSIMRQVFIFILKCIYAAFCGLIWLLQFKGRDRENLLMTLLGQLKFEGSVLFEEMKCLIIDGMNENKAFMSLF